MAAAAPATTAAHAQVRAVRRDGDIPQNSHSISVCAGEPRKRQLCTQGIHQPETSCPACNLQRSTQATGFGQRTMLAVSGGVGVI